MGFSLPATTHDEVNRSSWLPLPDIHQGEKCYKDTAGSDLVVVTAGFPRKPGMSRDDLLKKNCEVIQSTTEKVVRYSPNCILIMVTNPLDAMCQVALRASGFPRNRVIGMAGILDSARFRTFIAQELKVSVENVQAFVLGGHGDTMLPLVRYSQVGRHPLDRTARSGLAASIPVALMVESN